MAATGAHSHDLSVFLSPLEWHSSGKAAAPGLVGIAWLLLAGRAVCLQPLWQPCNLMSSYGRHWRPPTRPLSVIERCRPLLVGSVMTLSGDVCCSRHRCYSPSLLFFTRQASFNTTNDVFLFHCVRYRIQLTHVLILLLHLLPS